MRYILLIEKDTVFVFMLVKYLGYSFNIKLKQNVLASGGLGFLIIVLKLDRYPTNG